MADYQLGRISRFTTDGTFLSSFDCSRPKNGGIREADWVAVDAGGNAYVNDCVGSLIAKYRLAVPPAITSTR